MSPAEDIVLLVLDEIVAMIQGVVIRIRYTV